MATHSAASDPLLTPGRSRILHLPGDGEPRVLRIGPAAFVLSSGERTVVYDHEGRPRAGSDGPVAWRRGLGGDIVLSRRESGEWIHRRFDTLHPLAGERVRQARDWARSAVHRLRSRGLLEAALRLEPLLAPREGDAAAFSRVYEPVPILPPDQYGAVLLQFSRGCSWNRCAFCSFYRGREHRRLDAEQAARHALAVRALLGRGLSARRDLFLGDADAVSAPVEVVEGWLATAAAVFAAETPVSGGAGRPVASFVDLGAVVARDRTAGRRLAARGLRRLCAGPESGAGAVRRRRGKRGGRADVLRGAVPPDTATLFRRVQRDEGRERLAHWNPIAFRVPLFDPDAFLTRWLPWVAPLFSRAGALVWCAVVASAAGAARRAAARSASSPARRAAL